MIRYLKNLAHLGLAFIAVLFYRFPAKHLTVIGVTGTSGKTTTTHLIYEILKAAGKRVSMISSIAAIINQKSFDTGFHVTTPSPFDLQRFVRKAVDGGSEYLVLEISSHALDQHRVFGIPITIGVVTNIVHEHLDYHRTLRAYQAAKAKLLRGVKYSIVNKDDASFTFLRKYASGKMVTFAIDNQADYTRENVKINPGIIGKFNLYNCLAAVSVAMILKIDKKIITLAISQFRGIPGRMEEIKTDRPFKVIIDFAHKPDALEQVLITSRKIAKNKLIVIFGCAGLRDRLKRPMMGETAGKLADYTILTAEDPRSEDVRGIIGEIAKGCQAGGAIERDKRGKDKAYLSDNRRYFWRIADRQEAINFAIRRLAQKSDLVLICGKGHEKSMCYGKTEYPWDEYQAVAKALYGTVKITA